MSVVYESQCHAACDNCGKIDMTSTMRLADFKKKLMRKHIRKWKATAEINMDASRYKTVEIKANTERKARILAEEKLKKDGAFYVTNMRIEEIIAE